jgi:hypothetical protein
MTTLIRQRLLLMIMHRLDSVVGSLSDLTASGQQLQVLGAVTQELRRIIDLVGEVE